MREPERGISCKHKILRLFYVSNPYFFNQTIHAELGILQAQKISKTMKNFKFMGTALCALALAGVSSCSTTSKTSLNMKEFRTTQPQEAHVLTHMIAADLDVKSRVTKTYSYSKDEMKALGKSLQLIRRDALARACQETGADVLVGPIFSIQSKNLQEGLTVTLTGYPANYKTWKNAELSDTLLYRDMIRHNK